MDFSSLKKGPIGPEVGQLFGKIMGAVKKEGIPISLIPLGDPAQAA